MTSTQAREPQSDSATADHEEQAPELTNRSVLRAMALLKELGNHPAGATAAELATAVGLARPTAFRLLLSLAHTGILVRTEGRFSLGLEIARLGRIAAPYRELQPHVQVFLERLSSELGEATAFSAIINHSKIDLIAEASGSYMLSTALGYVGRDMPLHASATGKVVLADLSDDQIETLLPEHLEAFTAFTITDRDILLREIADVRLKGYATLDNELEEGLFAVAIPVRDDSGQLIGILSISGLDQRMKATNVHTFIAKLQESATQLRQNVLRV